MSGDLTNGLHLPDISIRNFRGIERLSVGRLGHVTLLAGRNGVGKTTVLEAVRVYAARAGQSVLQELLDKHEEVSVGLDTDQDPVLAPDFAALFHGRTLTQARPITIGPKSGTDDLCLKVATPDDFPDPQLELLAGLSQEADVRAVKVLYRGQQRLIPWITYAGEPRTKWRRPHFGRYLQGRWFDDRNWPFIECESLGPGLPGNRKLALLGSCRLDGGGGSFLTGAEADRRGNRARGLGR